MGSTDNAPTGSAEAREKAPGQLTGAVVIVALVSAVSGMLYGYDTGIISGALLQITKDFGIAESWKQVIAASILLGAVVGALTCSYLSERRGRKGTLVMLAVVFVVGSLWCAVAPPNPELLSAGRLVLGFAVGGGATQTAPDVRRRARPLPSTADAWCSVSRSPSASASSSRPSSEPRSRFPGGGRSELPPYPPR